LSRNLPSPISSGLFAVSFSPCWVQVEPERVNTQAAPTLALSPGPPISAVLPGSEESATLEPNSPGPLSPLPVSFAPCWVHFDSERVNTQAAPTLPLAAGPPTSAVLPSLEESATLVPNWPEPISPLPVSFAPCGVQVEPERVNTHAAPTLALSPGPPSSAVLPSGESATLEPTSPAPTSPEPSKNSWSFAPCWVQVEPERVNTQAAPTLLLSAGPPISAVLPSEESATLEPTSAAPISPLQVSFAPCWVQVEPERVNTHAVPTLALSLRPPSSAVLPSEESATL
jgi:hypothetical protein